MATGAGEYRHPVTIERESLVTEDDNFGHVALDLDLNWAEFLNTWARVMVSGGREFLRAQQMNAEVSSVLRIRYSRRAIQITSEMRVRHAGRKLNILSVFDVGDMGIEIELGCRERA